MALRHTIFHCNLICLFKTSLQILTVFAITLYFSHNVFLSQRIPWIRKSMFLFIEIDLIVLWMMIYLTEPCIYKFLSNFLFSFSLLKLAVSPLPKPSNHILGTLFKGIKEQYWKIFNEKQMRICYTYTVFHISKCFLKKNEWKRPSGRETAEIYDGRILNLANLRGCSLQTFLHPPFPYWI